MANRYWVGGTGNWSDAANHWSNASGGTPNSAYLPVSGDNVTFLQASTNCTLDVTPPNLGTLDFYDGTLNLNGKTLTCTALYGYNPTATARTLAFGTGNITIIGTVTTICNVEGPITITGTPVINVNSSLSAASTGYFALITYGGASHSISVNVLSGSYKFFVNDYSYVRNLNFTGFSGVYDDVAGIQVYGNLTLSSTMTTTAGITISVSAYGGNKTITTNGCVINGDLGVGAQSSGLIVQLQDNVTVTGSFGVGSSVALDLNGKTVSTSTCGFDISATVTFNGGTVICTGDFTGGATTVLGTGGTGNINMTSASPKTFYGNGATYNCIVNNDGAGALTITDSNTFTSLQNTVQPTTFTFTAGTTQTITNFNVSGTAGNLVTINSTSSSAAYLSKAGGGVVSCDYLNITNSSVTPNQFTWYAGANSVNNGGNSGWIFGVPYNNFFMLFQIDNKMPINKIPFKPGINRENTNYTNTGGFYDCNKIRFRTGQAEKVGGWSNAFLGQTFNGVARALWSWQTNAGENLIALGTNQRYYINSSGPYNDITPIEATVSLVSNPFTTTASSKKVRVADSTALTIGTFVTFSGASAVNGITINGSYEVIELDTGGYYILASTTASGGGSGGGASVTAVHELSAGSAVATPVSGWGAPPWGGGGWGAAAAVTVPIRLWSQGNFGDDLLFAPRNGYLYYWTKDTTTFAPGVTIGTKAASVTKTTQIVAAAVTTSTTFTIINSEGVDIGATVTGTGVPADTYVTSSYGGYTTITVNNAVTLTAGQSVSFSYSGKCVPVQVHTVLVSATDQFVIALGSTPYNPANFAPAFAPLLVRWSDQSVPYEWTPSKTNQSGEQSLSLGSYIVTGLSTRQETLIWTDRALYSMQYIGGDFVFKFQLMMDNISIMSQNAMISVNGQTFWMGQDKFYMYNGTVQTLNCTVRKYVFSNMNSAQSDQVVCGQNEQFNEIWWFYPSTYSQVNDSYVIYNYLDDVWYYGTLNRTAWLQSSLQSYPLAVFSIQTSYLSAAISSGATTIPLINAISYPSTGTVIIDAEQIIYTGVTATSLTGCTRGANGTVATSHAIYAAVPTYSPNQILYHEIGYDDQSAPTTAAISAYLQTADFDINGGDHYGYVWRLLPDFTFEGSTGANPYLTVTVNSRTNLGTTYTSPVDSPSVTNTQHPPTPPNTYPVEQFTGEIFTRVRGRQMNLYIQSNILGISWQMGTMRIDMRPDGRRA